MKKKKVLKKQKIKVDPIGKAYIISSFNNTIITITNKNGDTICSSSSGKMGFKGSKKSTPFASQCTAENVSEKSFKLGVRKVYIIINGCGIGRESAIRSLSKNLSILSIVDKTPIPHNGCRPSKKRRD